ncbi:hypothetical protein ACYSNO_00200 [Enterococcus sp. LJL98]
MLGLTGKNSSLSEDCLEEVERNEHKAYLSKGELTYIPLACKKCGIKNQGAIVKNGIKTTQTQIPSFKSTLTSLELKGLRFLYRTCRSTIVAQTTIVARFDPLRDRVYITKDLFINKKQKSAEISPPISMIDLIHFKSINTF